MTRVRAAKEPAYALDDWRAPSHLVRTVLADATKGIRLHD
jgi:hypothetical protein